VFFSLFLLSTAFYVVCSVRLGAAPGHPFGHSSVLFEIDSPRVIGDMTDRLADHYRTKVHPIYVLLVNPIGSLVARTELLGEKITKYAVAILINSAAGGACVALAFLVFLQLGRRVFDAALLAAIFAFSMGHFFLSIVPETSSLATASLLATYLAFASGLKSGRAPFLPWVLCGVFSLGVTTTNFAQTLVCFTILRTSLADGRGRKALGALLSAGRLVVTVVGATAVLAIVQRLIYPSSTLFFLPSSYREELSFASLAILERPASVLGELCKHFFCANVVAPHVRMIDMGLPMPGVTYSGPWGYSCLGLVTLSSWFALSLWGLARSSRQRRSPFLLGMICCLGLSVLLHCFYGVYPDGKIEYFLYSGNYTFCVVALFLGSWDGSPGRAHRLVLIAFAALLAVNNLIGYDEIVRVYGM
jgi:hypothetical protein